MPRTPALIVDSRTCARGIELRYLDSVVEHNGLQFIRRRWYFAAGEEPSDYGQFLPATTILGLFSPAMLQTIAQYTNELCSNATALQPASIDHRFVRDLASFSHSSLIRSLHRL